MQAEGRDAEALDNQESCADGASFWMPHIPDLGVVRDRDMFRGPRVQFQGGRGDAGLREVVLGVYHRLEDGCETKVGRLRSSLCPCTWALLALSKGHHLNPANTNAATWLSNLNLQSAT